MSEITGAEEDAARRLLTRKEGGGEGEAVWEEATGRLKAPWKGEYVKSMVYAGLDAIVTCFSLISSISANQLSSADVLVLGLANLVADGISMGFGDFVSTTTERDVASTERVVTEWEVTREGRPQQLDLVRQYRALGMTIDDAMMVVDILAKYKDILVDEKLAIQKRMLPPDLAEKPWKNGLVTFLAFLTFGSIPLLSFIILIPFTDNDSVKFIGACIMTGLALALLGIAKARIAGESCMFSAATTFANGAIAAVAAYVLGWTLRNVARLQD